MYSTLEEVMIQSVQLHEKKETVKIDKCCNVNIMSPSDGNVRVAFFKAAGSSYWIYIPEEKNSLLQEMQARQYPDEYLLLFINAGASTRRDLLVTGNTRIAFKFGVAKHILKNQCNIL